MYEDFFSNKKINKQKLLKFGFEYFEDEKAYFYKTEILDKRMTLEILIKNSKVEKINVRVIDNATEEEYILYKISSMRGSFVEKVRAEIELVLEEISKSCFDFSKTLNKQKNMILDYVKNKYNSDPEFLWEKGENFIVRRKDNQKWYGVFINISKEKLGILNKKAEKIDILNLRLPREEIEELLQYKEGYFSAYHMNKKNWISLSLDGNLEVEEIYEKIDKSYELVGNRKTKRKRGCCKLTIFINLLQSFFLE